MLFQSLFALGAIMSSVSALPAPIASFSDLNITAEELIAGSKLYDPSNPLHSRDSIPDECQFCDAKVCDSFRYYQLGTPGSPATINGGTGCFGWSTQEVEWTHHVYVGQDFEDGKNAIAQQVAQDGQFKTSKVGAWTGAFELYTSAFDTRDVGAFNKCYHAAQNGCASNALGGFNSVVSALGNLDCGAESPAGALKYFWNRNGNFAYIQHDQPR